MSQKSDSNERDSVRPRFQYSLRTLLIFVTAAAVACTLFFAFPVGVGLIATTCLTVSVAAVLTAGLIYGRGYARAFCIGALVPAGFCALPFIPYVCIEIMRNTLELGDYDAEWRYASLIFVGLYFLVVPGDGLLAVYVRRQLEPSRRRAAEESQAGEDSPETADADPAH